MSLKRADFRRVLAGKAVGVMFVFFIGVWMLMEVGVFERLGDPFVGVLLPVWSPVYLAILFASGLRNTYLPWLESGVLFSLLIAILLYVEAVLLAGISRTLRAGYRTYQQGETDKHPS